MPPAGSPKANSVGYQEEMAYPSRNIAYQAAGMITTIIENLGVHNEIRYTPAFIVYSLFSALIMHVYQMRSSNKQVVQATEQRLQVCMNALKEVSKVWLVAKMVHTLFESILGNKLLEERLQKAAGKRHKKPMKAKESTAQKRTFEDMDMGFSNGPPAPQVSYERSRPQTPALTPSRELPQQQNGMPQMTQGSPHMMRQPSDAFMGGGGAPSRSNTRPTTPFNSSFSYPGTPPELFLVTRNSPNISHDLWQNFQPDQLFPADTSLAFPQQVSPVQQHNLVDPALSRPQQQPMGHGLAPATPSIQNAHHMQGGGQHMQSNGIGSMQAGMTPHHNDPGAWAQMDSMNQANASNEETWSNSSRGQGPIVPTTLNVEDWFNFFGIHGDNNGLNSF